MASELELELEELRHLQIIAKRPRIVSLISSEIRNLEKLSEEAVPKAAPQPQAPAPIPTPTPTPISSPTGVVSNPVLNYSSLSSFSWDQDNEKIKIYLSLESVDEEKVETVFKPMSIDVKFNDVQGKNYRFAIPKLNKEVVPEKCKLLVKPKRVVITLVKASKGNWLDLQFKENKLITKLDKEKDPMAGIMDIVKNLYEEGDENTKRTIAKAWTDARSGKATEPLTRF